MRVYCLVDLICVYSSLSTSRGVGNVYPSFSCIWNLKMYSPSIHLGRGRKLFLDLVAVKPSTSIKFCLTLKGSETNRIPVGNLFHHDQYRIIFTSVGAGNNLASKFVLRAKPVQLPIYLERGRKQRHVTIFVESVPLTYRYLSTSRGAGNVILQIVVNKSLSYSYLSTSRGAGNPRALI